MPVDLEPLEQSPRILVKADLRPVAGTRIQPTGFPDLGPALYEAPTEGGGTVSTLLVESAQSMANRLEAVCWDDAADDLVAELRGLPFVRAKLAGIGGGDDSTSSLLEFHRLNSPYLMNASTAAAEPFSEVIRKELGLGSGPSKKKSGKTRPAQSAEDAGDAAGDGDRERDDVAGVVNLRRLAAVCFKYDPNSLVHGVFLEKIAGRLRHPRALSAFIEATDVRSADSGGVKFDRVAPSKVAGLDSSGGYTNVPFHRTEFTAREITAYFSLDLAQIRGYGLPEPATELLVVLALWKVRRFLESSMRLRSACELELTDEVAGIRVCRPSGFTLPTHAELADRLAGLIDACRPHFADPTTTTLTWNKPAG